MFKKIVFIIPVLMLVKCADKSAGLTEFEGRYDDIYSQLENNLDSALVLVDSTIDLAKEIRAEDEIAYSFYLKGYILDVKGDLSDALISYLNALKILENSMSESSFSLKLDVLLDLGNIFGKSHKYEEAIKFYERGLELASGNLDETKLLLLYSKAYDLWKLKRTNESIDILKEASSLSNELGDTTMIIKCFNLLGLTHHDNEFFKEAREYYQYILDLPTATDKDRARALHNTAIAFYEEENSEQAKIYFENALALKRKIRDKKLLFTTLFDLSEWHLSYGSLDSANRLAKQAELLYPKLLCEPESFKIYHLLSEISAKRGDYQESKFYADLAYDEALKFNDSTREIMEQKDKFQIDLILAGFNAEQEAKDQRFKATLNRWLIAILLVGCVIAFLAWRIWFRRWRTDLWNRIYACSIEIQERS